MKTILDIQSLPPCAESKLGKECEPICGNFERFLQDSKLSYVPKNVDPVLLEAEVNEFTKKCFVKFVESGLCSYLVRLNQEEAGASRVVPEGSFRFGQCIGLESHVQISKN